MKLFTIEWKVGDEVQNVMKTYGEDSPPFAHRVRPFSLVHILSHSSIHISTHVFTHGITQSVTSPKPHASINPFFYITGAVPHTHIYTHTPTHTTLFRLTAHPSRAHFRLLQIDVCTSGFLVSVPTPLTPCSPHSPQNPHFVASVWSRCVPSARIFTFCTKSAGSIYDLSLEVQTTSTQEKFKNYLAALSCLCSENCGARGFTILTNNDDDDDWWCRWWRCFFFTEIMIMMIFFAGGNNDSRLLSLSWLPRAV